MFNNLTLDQAIGQVIMVNPDTTLFFANDKLVDVCKKYSPGAFILFSNSIESVQQVEVLNRTLIDNCSIPPLISIDFEGGYVDRFKSILPNVGKVPLKQMAKDSKFLNDEVTKIAESLKSMKFNQNLSLVMDHDGGSRAISRFERSVGVDALEVFKVNKRINYIHQKHGLTNCMKHFPGHGYCLEDTHEEIGVAQEAHAGELETFKLGFNDDQMAPFLMTSHVVVKKWGDTEPITLSKHGIHKIRELGFTGAIISDDIFMKALTDRYTVQQIVTKFFNAGGTMLLVGNSRLSKELVNLEPLDFFGLLKDLVKSGKIKEKVIFDAAKLILQAKKKDNIL
jgi:beta-N-acetylhexosaminidase